MDDLQLILEAIRADAVTIIIVSTIYFIGLAGFINTQVNKVMKKLNDLEKKK